MTLFEFYRSKEWERFREIVISDRVGEDGFVRDEVTGEPIVKKYDIILHHKIELTEENVNDFEISLNPDNIMIVSHRTHNRLHNKLGYAVREVYLVYGAPLSGKRTWVSNNLSGNDLIIDMDDIWMCISGRGKYDHNNRLKGIAFAVRDRLIEAVKYRAGKWYTAYIVGGYALSNERERICRELGAREVFVDTPKEVCLERLEGLEDSAIDKAEYRKYIEDWFEKYTPPCG